MPDDRLLVGEARVERNRPGWARDLVCRRGRGEDEQGADAQCERFQRKPS